MARPQVPPVNATVERLERGGRTIWLGSEPAFSTRTVDWVPTTDGARTARYLSTLDIPPLMGPADGPPSDPDNPPPPPYVPPPVTTGEDVYAPPVSVPTLAAPVPDSWRDLLSRSYGYAAGSFPFRAAFFAGDLWEYDLAEGGLHLSLGTVDGLIDRTGNSRHGNAVQCNVGDRPTAAPQRVDGATWFNGVDSRVVTGFDPFFDFGRPAILPDSFYDMTTAHLPLSATPDQLTAFYRNLAYCPLHITHEIAADGTTDMFRLHPGPERHVLISGWARRQDDSANHLLFSGTGTEDIRCWVARSSNDVLLEWANGTMVMGVGMSDTTPDGRPVANWTGNTPGIDPTGVHGWPNAWPGNGQWVYWAVEIMEFRSYIAWWRPGAVGPGSGLWNRTAWLARNAAGLVDGTIAGGYPYDEYVYTVPELKAIEANVYGDPLTATWPWFAGNIIAGDDLADHATFARLYINGVEIAGRVNPDPGSLAAEGPGGYGPPGTSVGLNYPNMVLAPDPDLPTNWPWKEAHVIGDSYFRPRNRGTLTFGGRGITGTAPDLDPLNFTPATAWNQYPQRRATTAAWFGEMAEINVRRWSVYSVPSKDLQIRPWSYDWPAPSLADLAAV